MHIGYISNNELPFFSEFLLPSVVLAIRQNESVTALGISVKDVACGAVAGYVEGNTFKITSLFISENYRRRGYARSLLIELRLLLKLYSEVTEFEFSFTISHDEHRLFLPFLEKIGFQIEHNFGRTLYELPMEKLINSPLASGILDSDSFSFLPFSEISDYLLSAAGKKALQQDVPLPPTALTAPSILKDLSFAHIQNNEIDAFVIFDRSYSNKLTLSCIWVNNTLPMTLALLLRKSLKVITEHYPEESSVILQTVNSSSTHLLSRLFPGSLPISYTFHYRFPYLTDWRY